MWKKIYMVLAPTGVAALNVEGATIHSALKLSSTTTNYNSSYQTLIFENESQQRKIQQINTLIVDEISMVSASLLTFISDLFARRLRTGKILDVSWEMLEAKHLQYSTVTSSMNLFNTTSIVGYKQLAEQINVSLCNLLEVTNEDNILSKAVDTVNGEK